MTDAGWKLWRCSGLSDRRASAGGVRGAFVCWRDGDGAVCIEQSSFLSYSIVER